MTGLGLSNKKDDNFGEWYSEVIFKHFVLGVQNLTVSPG